MRCNKQCVCVCVREGELICFLGLMIFWQASGWGGTV